MVKDADERWEPSTRTNGNGFDPEPAAPLSAEVQNALANVKRPEAA
jgi:hypothetical protein